MSEIRRGDDVLLQRAVAIKLLREDGDPRSIARFKQEAQILARLHHPNVVTVFDTGVDGGEGFIVMELVEGPTLRELLDREGRLPPERAAEIASALASALGFAHEHGVIHRDLKPANVLFMPDGRVKLADMGIARLLAPEALTATLTLRGTPRYVSPEQARGDQVDSRADLYSLGCVLFEMLTGRTPFEGNLAALSYAHVHTPAPRVRSIDPSVPTEMDELVAAMLEKDPADRPQTAEDVRTALDAAMRHAAVTQTAPAEAAPADPTQRLPVGDLRSRPSARPRRSVWAWVVIPLALLAIIGVIALLARTGSDGRTNAAQPSTPAGGVSPTTEQSPPGESPPVEPVGQSPEEAAGLVLQTVSDGVAAGEITDHAGKDIGHEMDEILRELDHDGDVEKVVEKVGELRQKVSEALEKGEITSEARASAIDDALLGFAEAVSAAEE
jgi:eukaryotic-like serine/threonine-protein kinase